MDTTKKVGLWDIVLYATAMNFGIRWLATRAATGPMAIPIWAIAAVVFLLPLSMATMALSEKYPGEGAVYAWTRETQGPFMGFLCG
ncbi:MAG: amino acid permease, partial [Asticcacaulis sp.]|nr:amino acid permease [Asticcacaulis sp.]